MKSFQRSHPLSLFIYFIINLILVMIQSHPVIVVVQFISILLLTKDFKKYDLIILLLITISNPLFVHRGNTILLSFITLEALIYGFIFGLKVINMLILFRLMNQVLHSEHYIYLFSNHFPTLGLLISMIFSLIPRFIEHYQIINTCQKQFYEGHTIQRILNTFSIEVTWAFETSLDMLNSMKARFYGKHQRTYFHLFIFRNKDMIHIIEMICIGIICFISYMIRWNRFYYYPTMILETFNMIDYLYILLYILILLLPMLWEVKERLK
ncbi:MAG: energy-coupling factor transporter transmembrane protein EcfT [Erysipelotrichaceae bacterium]|nr:energy-coupling factor transporter transmembrane protein EcfT [Erysipelotrichaceae bacterium]